MKFRDPAPWGPRRATGLALGVLIAVAASGTGCSAQNAPASDLAIDLPTRDIPQWVSPETLASFQRRLQFGRNSTLAAAFIDESGIAFHAVGPLDAIGLDETTLYEIGSVTKTFTGVLLADAVVRGEVALDDPIDGFLPDSIDVPGEGAITLVHLATHTSGLPRLPPNLTPADPLNPYEDYSRDLLFAGVDGCPLDSEVGAVYQYSNFGMGLLGRILADRAGMSYEALVRERILDPLNMTMTGVALHDALKLRLIPGFRDAVRASNWDFGELEGAGALRSTATDMARYLAANMGLVTSPLTEAFAMSHVDRPEVGDTGLGWHMAGQTQHVIWHNGLTGGYAAFVGFVPETKRGVVILTNSASSVDDLGLHILDPEYPLSRVYRSLARRLGPIVRKRGAAAAVAAYAALKVEDEAEEFDFSERGLNGLGYELLRESKTADAIEIFELNAREHPESGNVYDSLAEAYVANGDTENAIANYQLSLEKNPGNVNAIERLRALGVEAEVPVVEVPRDVLETYVGTYELAPRFFIEVTLDGDGLRAQATGQAAFDLVPVSETMFSLAGIDARLEFTSNDDGVVDSLTLHQRGSHVAKRVGG